ncbi:dihydrodipicolinate synthase family protein [Oceanobacillus jeddahense]|uniref:Dihydrodipicolinate synthase family protein n=1 Tax=Oceanobacillus jeddahense TaxID=1462527 RepID=A0ABY5JWL4_9BACI|nr:dihydrodipicolinate synthase family protein [Oceanobacillus jeddahense]UUI02964.1 dihydrodipicolinate synthase family protein [Oceanobacillus jeddahense]
MKKLYGVTTAMVTPFTETGEIDQKNLRELTDFLIEKGVNCLYPLGTTGEMFKLTMEERKVVAETVVKQANGRVTVFIHVGAMNPNETVELAKHAHAIHADGIGVVTPAFFSTSEREQYEYFKAVSESVPEDFPIYVYNIPQCSANDLPVSVVSQLNKDFKNIIGIKYSFPDFHRVAEYKTINNADFSVVPGADKLFLPGLSLGCDGVVSGVSCVYPEPFVAVYQAYLDRDMEKAQKLQRFAAKYCEVLRGGANLSVFKEALKYRGLSAGDVRGPQLKISDSEIAELYKDLTELEEERKVLLP